MASDTKTFALPLPKGIVRDNSCQTQVSTNALFVTPK